MTKKELRNRYKILRSELNEELRDELSMKIANKSLELPIWSNTTYHLFLSIERLLEVDTMYLMQILHGKDKNIVVSKTDFDTHRMHHYLLTDATKIRVSKFGIPEPVEGFEIDPKQIEVVFIPLLAYDKSGNRVGYGKGFYDQFLAECPSNTLKIGISFFEPEDIISDIHESDIRLNYCVHPNGILKFDSHL